MRKRLIIANIIILILCFISSMTYNAITYSNLSYESAKTELSNYLSIVNRYYKASTDNSVVDLFDDLNNDIRITIIDLEGNVLADNSSTDIEANHLYREEIVNPGTYVTRHSQTLGKDMIYLASKLDNCYLRVAISVDSVNSYIVTYLWADGLITLLIVAVSILVLMFILKKSFEPLNQASLKLGRLTGKEINKGTDSVEALTEYIDEASSLLDKQLIALTKANDKIVYIVNNINQGIIIVEGNGNISLINNYALKSLGLELDKVLNKNYIYAIRDVVVNNAIDKTFIDKETRECDYLREGRFYNISINSFDEKLSIIISNITKLRNMENMKREFFQNASHELKSPLTSIIGYQQLISEGIISDEEEIKAATHKTIIEANRMNDTIIEMLELSKLESDVTYEFKDVCIKDIINDIITSFTNRIELKGLTVNLSLNDFVLKGCYENLYTLIKNIIDNAIKYNKDNGSITIKQNEGTLTIADTGIGIEQKNISRIFERFYRVDKAKSKALGSTGLGLAIANHICKMHRYELDVTSKIGLGTTFTIKFN